MIELHLKSFKYISKCRWKPSIIYTHPAQNRVERIVLRASQVGEEKNTAKDNHCQKPKNYEENTTTNSNSSSSNNNNNKCKQQVENKENKEKEDDQELYQVSSYCKPRPKTSERYGTLKCVASASCFSQF